MGHNVIAVSGNCNHQRTKHSIEDEEFDYRATMQGLIEPFVFQNMKSSATLSQYPEMKEFTDKIQDKLQEPSLDEDVREAYAEMGNSLIRAGAKKVKTKIENIFDEKDIDLVIPENVFSMPMQIPLAVALSEVIKEKNIPTIAIHHDFYWERERFQDSSIENILDEFFPPKGDNIRHVVINKKQQHLLKHPEEISFYPRPKESLDSVVLPNVFNYDFNPDRLYLTHDSAPLVPRKDLYNMDFKRRMGFSDEDIILLQHTRIVPRKNIERSVDLLKEIKSQETDKDRYKLVVSLNSMGEGDDYYKTLIDYIHEKGLSTGHVTPKEREDGDVIFIKDLVNSVRKRNGTKTYHYLDPYPYADFVLYPSSQEGWGNVFGEAIQAKKPLLVNQYPIYKSDIKDLGFNVLEIEDKIEDKTVADVLYLLNNPHHTRNDYTEYNFDLAHDKIGYDVARDIFSGLIDGFNR